jgi:peptide-methionine (S)-S-oxide reductase
VVTEIRPLEAFFAAEPEHDDYYRRNSSQPYCQVVISPKVTKARQRLANLFEDEASLPSP